MPGTGLEPVRSFPRGILSPLRLPIPPSRRMEVPPRFELGNKGFADLGLTTWRWHHLKKWSGRRDSNSRHLPWQGNALPLSHSRIIYEISLYCVPIIKFGGSYRTRTYDPLLVRQML